MALKTIPELIAIVADKFRSNHTGYIQGDQARSALDDIVNNMQVDTSHIVATGTANAANVLYGDNRWAPPGSMSFLSGGSALTIADTKASASITNYPAVGSGGPTYLLTYGYATLGDTPRLSLYERLAGAPASQIPASAYIHSADGSYWQIQPQNGEFWVEEFGGRVTADNNDTTPDSWQAFEDSKVLTLSQPPRGGGGTKIRICRGVYSLSKSFSLEGGQLLVHGCGRNATIIRTPWNVDAFQTQHWYGGDGQTFGHEGYPLNGNPTTIGALVYVSGSTHVYRSMNVGTPNMGAPPTGTGSGIVSGGAIFDYVRERSWSEMRGAAAAYSEIRDMTIWGRWTGPTDPNGYDEDQTQTDGAYHSGILMRTRSTIQDVIVLSYPGFGVALCADGDPLVRSAGNVNGWIMNNVRVSGNGHSGIRNGLSDSNAGMGTNIDCERNGWSGIDDRSFLSNTWVNVQCAFDGSVFGVGKWVTGVTHNGYIYIARPPTVGFDPPANYTNAPDTDANSWILAGGDSHATPSTSFPTWSAGDLAKYAPVGAVISDNGNSAVNIVSLYVEAQTATPQLSPQATVWGGALSETSVEMTRGAQVFYKNSFYNRLKILTGFNDTDGHKEFHFYAGADAKNGIGIADPKVFGFTDFEGNEYALVAYGTNTKRTKNADFRMVSIFDESKTIWGWTGQNTTAMMGRTVAQNNMFYASKIGLGDGGGGMYSPNNITVRAGGPPGPVGDERNGDTVINNTGSGPFAWQVKGGVWVSYP
jgi:hypothetical protein